MPTPSSNEPAGPAGQPIVNFSSCPEDLQQTQRSPSQSSNRVAQSGDSAVDTQRTSLPHDAPRVDIQSQHIDETILGSVQSSSSHSSRDTTSSPHLSSNATTLSSPRQNPLRSEAPKEDNCLDADSRSRSPSSLDGSQLNASSLSIEHDEIASFQSEHSAPSLGPDYSTLRTMPISPSSYLRPGSKFHGTQQSERQVYDVQVEIKHVDLRESFLCGYLRIQGLTEDHPTLTTYFEGEIIGSKYGFFTRHEDWGANAKVDLSHWSKFNAFRLYKSQAKRGPVTIHDVAQKENIFMRWKEHFLVPDHRVRTITGASFEGFYYICFNQLEGSVSGIYFHSKSEKFQQLELRHVPDRGCFSAMEFR
ncbi:hypothetical protein Golomagni_05390 [Golovinomyces magnicellulatus]|nr:hypothetical protein Golomagni_05390 [Golovinomyces magnicellulatus]